MGFFPLSHRNHEKNTELQIWVKARVEIKEQPQTAEQETRIQHSLKSGIRDHKILNSQKSS